MSSRIKAKTRATTLAAILLATLAITLTPISAPCRASPEYVYYGYVPVGTNAGDPNMYPQRRKIEDLVSGKLYNYTPPEGTALLDVIGIYDDTKVEIWDILARQSLASRNLNRLELWTSFIKFGTFFKVVADRRVSVYQSGGYWCAYSGIAELPNGDLTFYPSDEGGFVGKTFTFTPPGFPDSYITYRYGSNFLATALEDAHIAIYDSTGAEVTNFDLKQGESVPYNRGRLAARRVRGVRSTGGGNSIVFHAESTGSIVVRSVTHASFLAVPAVTGGFAGKLFATPAILAFDEVGSEEVLIIVPIEAGKVSVYDNKMRLITEKTFTQADVDAKAYWYCSLGKSSQTVVVKSTCRITVLEGSTYVPAYLGKTTIGIDDLGSNIAFMGARANEEIRFYVPSSAVLFAPEDLAVDIDGETKTLKKDQFVLLESGVHSVTPDHEIILQLNSAGNMIRVEIWGGPDWVGGSTGKIQEVQQTQWTEWGSYLITVEDVKKSFEVPRGLAETASGGMDWMMITAGVVAAVAVGITAAFFILKRRR